MRNNRKCLFDRLAYAVMVYGYSIYELRNGRFKFKWSALDLPDASSHEFDSEESLVYFIRELITPNFSEIMWNSFKANSFQPDFRDRVFYLLLLDIEQYLIYKPQELARKQRLAASNKARKQRLAACTQSE